jgi:hypothetical protein
VDGTPLPSWTATFDRLQVGAEEARGVALTFTDKPHANADLILGADFFLAHRVFVARSQNRLYIVRNDGAPVLAPGK